MKTAFQAHAFRDEDRDLASSVERLLASHNVKAVTGAGVGGDQITPAVQERIRKADGLVALLTRRDRLAASGYTTHGWVKAELNFARDHAKRAIALVETEVVLDGPYAEHERIVLDRERPLEALLKLSETIGLWKRESGRTLKVQILPDEVALQIADGDGVTCRYRFMEGGSRHEWREGELIPETGGTFLYLRGVQDEYMVEIEIDGQGRRWYSRATSQHLPVAMLTRGA